MPSMSAAPSLATALVPWILASVVLVPAARAGAADTAAAIVGTSACPKLNEHGRQACRFKRGNHEFQVWPARIAVEPTSNPALRLVTSSGHADGMFDHVLRSRKDDHVSFQCFVGSDGKYYGPTGFRIQRGGVWSTYGEGVVTAATVATGAVAAYFSAGVGAPAGAVGGAAAKLLGDTLSRKFGSRSWEAQAGREAVDICGALAR